MWSRCHIPAFLKKGVNVIYILIAILCIIGLHIGFRYWMVKLEKKGTTTKDRVMMLTLALAAFVFAFLVAYFAYG